MTRDRLTFPLASRRRLLGRPLGASPAARRGAGVDRAGARAYRYGDDVRAIDHRASARLSSARGEDAFVVREHLTEEAPAVVVVLDGAATMCVQPDGLPLLDKPATARAAAGLIGDSARAVRSPLAALVFEAGTATLRPLPPGEEVAGSPLPAALATLATVEPAPAPGSFVFVLSDLLEVPAERLWLDLLARRLDPVPVVIQDPAWEQSFPDTAGVAIRLREPGRPRARLVRFGRGDARARREANERRLAATLAGLQAIGLDPVLLGSADVGDVWAAFIAWSELRRRTRGGLA